MGCFSARWPDGVFKSLLISLLLFKKKREREREEEDCGRWRYGKVKPGCLITFVVLSHMHFWHTERWKPINRHPLATSVSLQTHTWSWVFQGHMFLSLRLSLFLFPLSSPSSPLQFSLQSRLHDFKHTHTPSHKHAEWWSALTSSSFLDKDTH